MSEDSFDVLRDVPFVPCNRTHCSALSQSLLAADIARKPNVLFIAVDDLNHWVGHLGRNSQSRTPNIDRLAARGVTFTNAHCAAPVCNPSRAALMSGLRPSTTGVYANGQTWQLVIDKKITLTTQFLAAGYNVFGTGKIYHSSAHREGEWTEYHVPRGGGLRRHPDAKDDGVGGIKFAPLESGDEAMPDYRAVDYALAKLAAEYDKPFFLAVGLTKPHMPWNVPKKYFDLFPLDRIELPPTRDDDLADVPPAGVRMADPTGDHAAIVASGRWKEAVQAYLATIAFADAMIGRLLDGLDKSPHRDNTIIVLWGDHGWHLGEKKHWRKFALWEEATRAARLGRTRCHQGGRRLQAPCRFHVDLPDALRSRRHRNSHARRRPQYQAATCRSQRQVGTPRADDVSHTQPQCPQRNLALHPLCKRRRGAIRPYRRPERMEESRGRSEARYGQNSSC